MTRGLKALWSGFWLLVALIGLPWALIRFIGWPFPRRWPDQATWQAWLAQPLTRTSVLDGAACVVWLMWACLLAAVLAEVVGRVRRVRVPRLRLASPVQGLAAGLLGTLVVALTTAASRGTAAPAHLAPAVAPLPHLPSDTSTTPAGAGADGPTIAASSTGGHSPSNAAPAQGADARSGQLTLVVDGKHYTYTVRHGDTLSGIADDWLRDPDRWPDIYRLNQGRHFPTVGGTLTNPNLIYPGWTLYLPDDAQPPASATPAPTQRLDGPPAPAPPAGGHTVTTPAPGPSTVPSAPTSADDPARHGLTPPTTQPTSPSPTTADSPPAAGDSPGSDSRQGLRLPSGAWVSLGLATTIATVATLVRLRRRRRARLRFPIPLGISPTPTPVPRSLQALDAVGTGDVHTADSPLPGVLPIPPAVLAPIGVDADGSDISLFDLPGPGIAVRGDGARPAARAILATALSTGVVEQLAARPVVVTTADTLTGLLPPGTPAVGLDPDGETFDGERLLVLATTVDAVTHLEEELIHRRRVLDELHADTVAELNVRGDHAESLPPYLLLVPGEDRYAARIAEVAAHSRALDIYTVILGTCPGIPTYQVDRDGTLTSPHPNQDSRSGGHVPRRLATLASRDLVDVLDLVRQAAPRPEDSDTDPSDDAEPAVEPGQPATPEIPVPTHDEAAPVGLRVLGPVTLATHTGPIATGLRRGSLAVLATLAAYPHGRTLTQIATDLHPDTDEDAAIKRVRTDINSARRVLREATSHTGMFIVYDSATGLYRIDPNLIEVDLWRMLAALGRANQSDDEATCLTALQEATALYRGDFAADQDRAWITDYATTYRHQILSAYARVAEILEPDHPDQAVAALEHAIDYDPINEELYQRAIRIHGRQHRPDAVRRTLNLLEDRLADLGEAEPSEATRRIAARQLHAELPRR